jgi:hypothetical protein
MVSFRTKNPHIGQILEGFAMVDVDKNLMAIWPIFRPFGKFYGYLVYFSPFWYVVPIKIWQP